MDWTIPENLNPKYDITNNKHKTANDNYYNVSYDIGCPDR